MPPLSRNDGPSSQPTPTPQKIQHFHEQIPPRGTGPSPRLPESAALCTSPPRGSTTKRKLTTPHRLHGQQTDTSHTRKCLTPPHSLPAPPPHSLDLLRHARAPTSAHSIGFCVIRVCISSSSACVNRGGELLSFGYRGVAIWRQEWCSGRSVDVAWNCLLGTNTANTVRSLSLPRPCEDV